VCILSELKENLYVCVRYAVSSFPCFPVFSVSCMSFVKCSCAFFHLCSICLFSTLAVMHELNKYSIERILEVSEDVTTIDVMLLVDCFVLFL